MPPRPDLSPLLGLLLTFCGCLGQSEPGAAAAAARAKILIGRGEFDAAVATLNAAVADSPDDPELYADRALAKERLGDDRGAEEDYSRAIDLDPRHFRSLNDRAAIRARGGRFEGAISDLTAAIDVQPTTALPYANRAQALIDSGDAESALSDLAAVERIDPRDPMTPLRRGDALLMLGRDEDALLAYDAAVRMDPGSVAAHRQRARALVRLSRYAAAAEAMAAAAATEPSVGESEEAADVEAMRRLDAALSEIGARLRVRGDEWAAVADGEERPLVVAADFDGRAVVDAEEVRTLRQRGGLLALPVGEGYAVSDAASFDLTNLVPASYYVDRPAETPPPVAD